MIVFAKAANDQQILDILALAQRYEAPIAAAIEAMLNDHAASVPLVALEEALRTGARARIEAIIASVSAARVQALTDVLTETAWTAGGDTFQTRPFQNAQFTIAFNRLNPTLTDWLRTYSLNLIREINDRTREGIRAALDEGQRAGQNPRDTARQIKPLIGLTERQARAVGAYRRELQGVHQAQSLNAWGLGKPIDRVNGAQVFKPNDDGSPKDGIDRWRLRDFRFDRTVAAAQRSGKALTPEQIDTMVNAYAKKYLAHRATTIARTESLRAAAAGQHEAWRQAVASGAIRAERVRRYWVVAKDERTCRLCAPIPGMNKAGVGLSAPFSTPLGPIQSTPLHPNCRCTISYRLSNNA